MIQDVVKAVIKDLETLESDREGKQGRSQNKAGYSSEYWIKDAYHNALRTAIALRKLIDNK